jgi:MFS family permease
MTWQKQCEKAATHQCISQVYRCYFQVFWYMSKSYHASISDLGKLSLSRAMCQALSSPIAGILGDSFDRTNVILIGAILWAIMNLAISVSTTLSAAMIFCSLNGCCFALVVPLLSSLLSDVTPSENRGKAFGMMAFISSLGGMLGAYYATRIGSRYVHIGGYTMDGWRVSFQTLALISILAGVFMRLAGRDPKVKSAFYEGLQPTRGIKGTFIALYNSLAYLVRVPSFVLIILQGIVGSIPWTCMSFFTIWFQTMGFSSGRASSLVAIFTFGCALGGIVGGFLGDFAAKRSENHGRIMVGQSSILIGIPITIFLCSFSPGDHFSDDEASTSVWYYYASKLFLLGLASSWCGCNNSAILVDIVPRSLFSQVYAFDRTFEGAVGALGAPLVGLVTSRVFGFNHSLEEAQHNDEIRGIAAMALSKSLLWCLCLPWTLCLIFYSLLHFKYPKDRKKALLLTSEKAGPGYTPQEESLLGCKAP